MNQGNTIFAQVLDFLPKRQFRRCVARYQGNHRIRSFTCSDQFLCMAFAQLTYRDSLRDIECCLRAMKDKLYHFSSAMPESYMPMKTLVFSLMRPFMPWMRPLSIYAYPFFRGRNFANPRALSSCIHYQIFVALYQRWFRSLTAKSMSSIFLII